MGLFKLNYDKPGPGVSKNAPQKRRFVVFFELLGRNFWKILRVNYLFLLCCVPICALIYLFGMLFSGISNSVFGLFLVFSPLILLSFPLLGMTYICRNFVREEPSFIWYDFFHQIKLNFKTTLLHGVVNYLVLYLGLVAIRYYYMAQATNAFLLWPLVFVVIALLFYFIMSFYIYMMILTFDLPYRAIVKNAFIFVFAGFLRNILLSIVLLPIWFLMVDSLIQPMFHATQQTINAMIFPAPFLALGLCGFSCYLVDFVTYPVICKYMIEPLYGKKEDGEIDLGPKDTDHYHPLEETEEAEYVYVNGRLVKREEGERIFNDEVQK